jgi:hypothetical protein
VVLRNFNGWKVSSYGYDRYLLMPRKMIKSLLAVRIGLHYSLFVITRGFCNDVGSS